MCGDEKRAPGSLVGELSIAVAGALFDFKRHKTYIKGVRVIKEGVNGEGDN